MWLHELDDARLQRALRETGGALPGARRDLGAAVVAALRSDQPRRRPRTRLVVALATLVVLLAGAAVAGVIMPGVGLRLDGAAPPPPGEPLVTDDEFLGERTTLEAARDRVDFAVRVPELRDLGQPQVYVADGVTGHRVALLYGANEHVPALAGTAVGLFVSQFRGDLRADLLTKVARRAQVTPVDIGGTRGWWIEGAHEVLYLTPAGDVAPDESRFAGNTLLWAHDGVTVRLESALPRREAITVAARMTG